MLISRTAAKDGALDIVPVKIPIIAPVPMPAIFPDITVIRKIVRTTPIAIVL